MENPIHLAVPDQATHFTPHALESIARASGGEPVVPVATP
jgi:hypothetical protein